MTQEEKDNIYNWLDEHINKDTSIIYSGISACMDDEVPYPCLKCPFNCYKKK